MTFDNPSELQLTAAKSWSEHTEAVLKQLREVRCHGKMITVHLSLSTMCVGLSFDGEKLQCWNMEEALEVM